MKKYGWLILTVALVALIGGAAMLYNNLGSNYGAQQLATREPPAAVATEPTQTTAEAETDTDTSAEETQPLELAPDFTVVDGEGNEVKLSDFFGKPIVLNFWASWCGPCKSEMPDFDEIWLEKGDEIHFLMVNMTDGYQETLEQAKAFLEESGYSFPVYYDVRSEAAMVYGITSIPATFFIDASGVPVAYGRGAMNAETLLQGIDMITG